MLETITAHVLPLAFPAAIVTVPFTDAFAAGYVLKVILMFESVPEEGTTRFGAEGINTPLTPYHPK